MPYKPDHLNENILQEGKITLGFERVLL